MKILNTYKTHSGKISSRNISNVSRSGIIGFYDRKVGSAPSCRLTRFNTRHFKKYLKCIPYVEREFSL